MSSRMQSGLVSTIIPVFNRPQMVAEAIKSVLSQDYRPVEIIVVNDGSTDHTDAVLAALSNEHAELTILTQQNSGPGVARELGRLHAQGEYIQYLDSDDLLLPTKFSQQISALHSQPECGVAYGKTELSTNGQARNQRAWKRTGEKIDSMFPAFLRQRWWATSTPLYRRTLTDRAGPWCSTINEEDWEYDCRIAALGTRLAFVDDFVSIHRRHDQHLSHEGTTDSAKLADRCHARQQIFLSARRSSVLIPIADLQYFAKSVFLLARQCASSGLAAQSEEMLALAIRANGKATYKHRIFLALGKVFGWSTAARIARLVERLQTPVAS
ncbi:MAG: glycosyltransferase family 2 protein [Gammaproteobacteria bacterium]|nr:glycosyltransferase family 2 protein [Gammaproteobacteria bacterium]